MLLCFDVFAYKAAMQTCTHGMGLAVWLLTFPKRHFSKFNSYVASFEHDLQYMKFFINICRYTCGSICDWDELSNMPLRSLLNVVKCLFDAE